MKTLKDAFKNALPLEKLATEVPVSDSQNPVGKVLSPLHEKIYNALIHYDNKPFYIEWALFALNDGTLIGYADVVSEPNPNMNNYCFGLDERDLKPINILGFAKDIDKFKNGKVVNVFNSSFMQPYTAYTEYAVNN